MIVSVYVVCAMQALSDAILAVTAMNTDLSVEKIEIVHNRTVVQ